MKTIFKYPFSTNFAKTIVEAPALQILYAGLDPAGRPCIWCEVETTSEPKPITVHVVGTGGAVPKEATRHIGSFVQGVFVWHVYV